MQRRVYSLMIRRKSQKISNETLQKPKYGNYLRGYERIENTTSIQKVKTQGSVLHIPKKVSNLIVAQQFNKLFKYYQNNKIQQPDIAFFLQKDAEKNIIVVFLKKL